MNESNNGQHENPREVEATWEALASLEATGPESDRLAGTRSQNANETRRLGGLVKQAASSDAQRHSSPEFAEQLRSLVREHFADGVSGDNDGHDEEPGVAPVGKESSLKSEPTSGRFSVGRLLTIAAGTAAIATGTWFFVFNDAFDRERDRVAAQTEDELAKESRGLGVSMGGEGSSTYRSEDESPQGSGFPEGSVLSIDMDNSNSFEQAPQTASAVPFDPAQRSAPREQNEGGDSGELAFGDVPRRNGQQSEDHFYAVDPSVLPGSDSAGQASGEKMQLLELGVAEEERKRVDGNTAVAEADTITPHNGLPSLGAGGRGGGGFGGGGGGRGVGGGGFGGGAGLDDAGRYRDRDARQTREQYELPPENPFLKTIDQLALSTFSIDVDTASYANTRRFITNRQLPPSNAVRLEEFINYFSYNYPQPDGSPFSVSLDVAECPWRPNTRLVRIGIQGQMIERDERPPSNLVFLIDVSGSMQNSDKLPLLQRSMLMLVDQLTENDRVAIVTYASNAGVRLPPTSGDQKEKIRAVINGLVAGGSTHGSAGISTAYDLARDQFIDEGTNRVILATDGDLNVGVTSNSELVNLIKERAESGVFLSVLGFGTGNLQDAKLEGLADNGNGHYAYIDSIREAQKVLVAEMSGSLVTIAKDVKIQVEFNPAEVAAYRLIGYENRKLKNEDFANDRVDAGDIGAGHSVTALYEIVPVGALPEQQIADKPKMRYQTQTRSESTEPETESALELTDKAESGELLTLALRYKKPDADVSELLETTLGTDDVVPFAEASQDFRFAAAVAGFGMKLRQSAYAGQWTWSDVENTAAGALGTDAQGHRAEMVDLVRQVRQILGR